MYHHVHAILTAFGWRRCSYELWLLHQQHIQIPECPQSASQLHFTHSHNFTYLFKWPNLTQKIGENFQKLKKKSQIH
jgi:hypothetical protein